MCVIIVIPKGKEISYEEFECAWDVNPDGAGFCIRTDKNKIYYKRGFMEKIPFYIEICKYMGNYEMVLHFRISTSNEVNPMQTHPYNANHITLMEGITSDPVTCMNGIIAGQKEYIINKIAYNDTMSYIYDNNTLFNMISDRVIDIIEEDSGAKWCCMTPQGTYISSQFFEENGIYYSNDNHLRWLDWTSYYEEERRYKVYDLIEKEL